MVFVRDRLLPPVQELVTWSLALSLAPALACTETLDAGSTRPHGLLPVDERSPIVLVNDGAEDNWQGEYAVLLANGGGSPLAGIVVDATPAYSDLDTNVTGWRSLLAAARQSGFSNIPEPTPSVGAALAKPASGRIEDTVPNDSEGARLILDRAAELSLPYRPLVVAMGTRLTDVADAYLLDPTIADKIVVVASLGSLTSTGAAMSNPNGEMDPWADLIVSKHLRYVQVSAYYDQTQVVPASRLSELPDNALGAWMAKKQPHILSIAPAADQVSVLAAGLPSFTTAVSRVDAPGDVMPHGGPDLVSAKDGPAWLVTQSDGALAITRFWELLGAARLFAP